MTRPSASTTVLRSPALWLPSVGLATLIGILGMARYSRIAVAAPDLTLSPTSAAPGVTVQASGNGWPAGASLTLMWDQSQRLTEAKATATGAFTASFTVPAGATTGAHKVSVVPAPPAGGPSGGMVIGSPPPGLGSPPGGIGSPPPGAATSSGGMMQMVTVDATFTVVAATASATSTPTATPTSTTSATPAATASPSPTPTSSPTRYRTWALDMNRPCIPTSDQNACDDERQRLWRGDSTTWTVRLTARGIAQPTSDDVLLQAFLFRVAAGDPTAVAAVARNERWPHVRITAASAGDMTAGDAGAWVEVSNLGGGAQDMSGWSLRMGDSGLHWQFASGLTLEPGQACRWYAGTPGEDPCAGASSEPVSTIALTEEGNLELWVDGIALKANEVRYAADPNRQPAPPNLKGVP
jgi:hypothetical protein